MVEFSHLDMQGNVKMVDVTDKITSKRLAIAEATIHLSPETIQLIGEDSIPKGNVLTTAKIAGIQAAKSAAQLIPLCHPVRISHADIQFQIEHNSIVIQSQVKASDVTGIEMEALTAVSIAALTIYDMCKAVDQSMIIENVHLIEKTGGKSGSGSTFRPVVGILVLSDRISAGSFKDRSGEILKEGFSNSGCKISQFKIISDDPDTLKLTIKEWGNKGVDLIITSGGTGLSPRDITVQTLEPLFDKKLPGIENALHRFGLKNTPRAMFSRLTAGVIGTTIIICLPGSTGAAKDAIQVLIPSIFHAFDMIHGNSHEN
ncbi:MAG: bifunctional molybdenum cofactor biosynthesis protein MoaC/MoaB [Fidelibacterota bacterium]